MVNCSRCLPENPCDPTSGHANNSMSWRDRMTLCNGTRVRRERARRDACLSLLYPSRCSHTHPSRHRGLASHGNRRPNLSAVARFYKFTGPSDRRTKSGDAFNDSIPSFWVLYLQQITPWDGTFSQSRIGPQVA